MERMTKGEGMTPEEYIAMIEEENRKLKEQLERMKIDTMYDMKDINSLYEENKKLKATIDAFARQVRRLETRLMKYEKVDRGRFIDKTLTTSEQESLFSNHL